MGDTTNRDSSTEHILNLESLSVARREVFGETESQKRFRECMGRFEERVRQALRKKYGREEQ